MILVMGIDPGVANTGFGVVRVAGGQMTAVDGGVIEAPDDAPLETRLARIHAELEQLIGWHEPAAVALEDLYFGKNVQLGARRRPGARGRDAGRRPARDPLLRLHAAGGEDGGLRHRLGGQAPGPADGRHAARAGRARPSPTTPPTRSRSRSATPGTRAPRRRSSGRRAARGERRMIASVRGEVLVRRPDHVVIESGRRRLPAHGLGRDAEGGAGERQGARPCTPTWSPATTRSQLYGFASEEERDLFLHLTSVSGIGPKVAIAILSGGTPRELLRAIAAGDAKRFQAVPGIGKRTSERVIVELREKVAGELEEGVPALAAGADDDPRSLAREGLMHLGYTLDRGREAARRRRGRDARGPDRRAPCAPPGRAGRRREHLARSEHRRGRRARRPDRRRPDRRGAARAATRSSTARCARAGSPTSSTRSR